MNVYDDIYKQEKNDGEELSMEELLKRCLLVAIARSK